MKSFNEFLAWENTTRDIIDFKKSYVDLAGDLLAGLMLSEIIYWYLPGKNDEHINKLKVKHDDKKWIAVRYKDWYERIRITTKQAERAMSILIKKGVLTKKVYKFNGEPTVHIRLNEDEFLALMEETIALNSLQRNSISATKEMEIPYSGDPLTKTTTKTTTEEYVSLEEEEIKPLLLKKQKKDPMDSLTGDHRAVVDRFCRLWGIAPPMAGEINYWRSGAQQFIHACNGQDPGKIMTMVYDRWKREGMPFDISTPGSIIKFTRSTISKMGRRKTYKNADNVEVYEDGTLVDE